MILLRTTLNLTCLRFASLVADQVKQNRFSAECMLVISAIMHLGASGLPDKAITRDDSDRLQLCLKVLCDKSSLLRHVNITYTAEQLCCSFCTYALEVAKPPTGVNGHNSVGR